MVFVSMQRLRVEKAILPAFFLVLKKRLVNFLTFSLSFISKCPQKAKKEGNLGQCPGTVG
jgi:hypothetical protein